MSPEMILGINKLITENKPKSFDELRLLVNNSPWKDIEDQALQAFGIRKEEVVEVVKTEKRKTLMKTINKSLLGCYMEAVADMQRIIESCRKIDCAEGHEAAMIHAMTLLEKHKTNIKESEIWN
jgi:hypothetical protein